MTPTYPDDLKVIVNEALRRFFPQRDERLRVVTEAMAYTLFSDGKRFRPVLALLCAEAVGADPRTVLPVACAIEFIHTYSLIHDDLPAIDNDQLRRGRETCHIKFGEAMAIMAGDALFAEAFALILTEQRVLSSQEQLIDTLTELAAATGIDGMVGGQVVDITQTGHSIDQETLEFIHNRKTGSLIIASARCGAIIGGGNRAQIAAIADYAGHLGLAFQIIDDILDVVGSADATGKNVGRDSDNRKTTFPGKLGVNKSRSKAQLTAKAAVEALKAADLKTERLIEMADFVLTRTS